MTSSRIYLDHNATTPVDTRVADAIRESLEVFGNPSSIHEDGRAARDRVEGARRSVAAALSAAPEEIVFTSGGTEADALGIVGLARGLDTGGPIRLVATALEHPACHGPLRGLAAGELGGRPCELAYARVEGDGRVDPSRLAELCEGPGVVVLQLVNHELGTVQDVAAAAELAHRAGMVVHCDAVQAVGKIPVSVSDLGVDSLALSGHKIGGPKGIGALWIRRGLDLAPLHAGGHQERERRPGTENLMGAVGLGRAAELVGERLAAFDAVRARAQLLEQAIAAIDDTTIHGAGAPRVGNTVNAGFRGAAGEVVVQALDLAGVSASTGAACSSGSVDPSPVLLGLGLAENEARSAVRFSLGPSNTDDEIREVARLLVRVVERARSFT